VSAEGDAAGDHGAKAASAPGLWQVFAEPHARRITSLR
jgi:hypothetical protein